MSKSFRLYVSGLLAERKERNSRVLFVLAFTLGGSLFGIFGGLIGFTISGISSIIVVIGYLIYYSIVMGITGAFGGMLASKK